jgi:hypothetical protein
MGCRNKLTINLHKTEIVIHKSRLKHCNVPDPIFNIQQFDSVKLLGVIFNNHLSFTGHIDYICSAVNQRFHLIKQIQHQGLSQGGSEIVFNAPVLSKFFMPASHFMVTYVNPILQDGKQALILLALISVFLFFRYYYCWAGKKFCSALLRTTVEVKFVVLLLAASQFGDFCT